MPKEFDDEILFEDEVEEEVEEKPKKSSKKKDEEDDEGINEDALMKMMMTDMGEGGLEELKPDVETDELDVETKPDEDSFEPLGKYSDEVIEDVTKHPEKYIVKTSEGEMNLRDALDEGWNPDTDEFDHENSPRRKKEQALGGLSESDQQAIGEITDRGNAHIPPAEGEQYGLEPGNPMLHQEPQGEEETDPAMLQAMMGGMM
jgi:hypothetical protein